MGCLHPRVTPISFMRQVTQQLTLAWPRKETAAPGTWPVLQRSLCRLFQEWSVLFLFASPLLKYLFLFQLVGSSYPLFFTWKLAVPRAWIPWVWGCCEERKWESGGNMCPRKCSKSDLGFRHLSQQLPGPAPSLCFTSPSSTQERPGSVLPALEPVQAGWPHCILSWMFVSSPDPADLSDLPSLECTPECLENRKRPEAVKSAPLRAGPWLQSWVVDWELQLWSLESSLWPWHDTVSRSTSHPAPSSWFEKQWRLALPSPAFGSAQFYSSH